MKIKITEITGLCQVENCDKPAEVIAAGRETPLGCFCKEHEKLIENEGNPEYTSYCPNCGCGSPVN